MEQKKLLASQRNLIALKRGMAEQAIRQAQSLSAEVQATVNLCANEIGIDIEKEKWNLSDDGERFERADEVKATEKAAENVN